MLRVIALAGISTIALAGAAHAADQFYVVHDKSAKKCVIVEKKPSVETMVVVGDKVFTTRAEAEAATKTIAVCKDG